MVNNIFNSSTNYVNTSRNATNNTQVKNQQAENTQNNSNKNVSKNDTRKQISYMINQYEQQTANFEKLVSSIFSKQSNKSTLISMASSNKLKNFFQNLQVDSKTIEQAKKDISEDGYYGVKQTSERILSFAKAVAGDDPKKIEKMRNAVEKGFKQVERMWGDKLPEICQKTYDKVMETFDSWQSKTVVEK